MTTMVIKDGFDTARLVACYRAVESERPGALFHDPLARRLAGTRGEELMQSYPHAKEEVWAIATRTRLYDEILLQKIEQGSIDTVINLAAGLDTRPYRLALPTSLRWIECDDPTLLKYKADRLIEEQPVCQLERIPLDITDHQALNGLLTEVSEHAKQILVLTEGLLIYLMEEQVIALAEELHAHLPIRWWLTEIVAPAALKKNEQSWNTLTTEKMQMRFSPEGGSAFFQTYGWQVAEFHSVLAAALRFKAPIRFRWLLRLLTRITPEQSSTNTPQTGFVLLERIPSSPKGA